MPQNITTSKPQRLRRKHAQRETSLNPPFPLTIAVAAYTVRLGPASRNLPGPSCTGRTPEPVPGKPEHRPVPHTLGPGKQPPRAAVANCSNHSRHC